jgi:hypothetical protein
VRRRPLVLGLLLAATTPLASLAAQVRPGIEIQLPTATRLTEEGPLVRTRAMLSDSYIRELLQSGFPARMHYRVELWADGRFFDELQRSVEWDVIVRLSGVEQSFEVIQLVGTRPLALGVFQRVEDAEAAASRPVRVPISAPVENRRVVYLATPDEVNRWLQGEFEPAVRGERSPGTALTRGFRALATRLLGGARRDYSQRSPSFRPSTESPAGR